MRKVTHKMTNVAHIILAILAGGAVLSLGIAAAII